MKSRFCLKFFVNDSGSQQDFEEFSRKMRFKWHFRNEPTPDFSGKPSFKCELSRKPSNKNPSLELFLSQI